MTNFQYTAINQDDKKISGKIVANNEDLARQELHRLGFSVLNIQEAVESNTQADVDMQIFEFEGLDQSHKFIKGTIEGSSLLGAYRRLVEEYTFKVNYVCRQDASLFIVING